MQVTPALLQAAFQNFNARFNAAFTQTPIWSDDIVMEVPSASRDERFSWVEGVPAMREWVGERLVHNMTARAHVVPNKDFELTLEVDRNDFEDDRLGTFAPYIDLMGVQARKWRDQLVAKVLQAGISTNAWDGQFFWDTDHPINFDNAGAGTYSNRFTGTALNAANYATVRATMGSRTQSNGLSLTVQPNVLMVPPQLEGAAKTILNTQIIGGSGTNIWQNTATVKVVPELANEPTVWYLLDTTKPVKPFVFLNRKAPMFDRKDQRTDDEAFWRKKFVYGVDARGNVGYALPFLAARCEA